MVDPAPSGGALTGRRVALLTVSSSRAGGSAEVDRGGPALAEYAGGSGLEIVDRALVADEVGSIGEHLIAWADQGIDLVLTTGGTGVAPSDVTPDATRAVVDREVPGIAEAMRAVSREFTPHWMLSRATAGVRGRTMIINFPGSPKSIGQIWGALEAALPHALELIAGEPGRHE